MLDHIGVSVSALEKTKEFYLAALKPLGYTLFMEGEKYLGLAVDGKPDLWFHPTTVSINSHTHIALRVENRELVDKFYEAAIAAGGKDNGAPGLRTIYHPSYYGAFVLDPDGHNLEAVCHKPE